MTIDERRDSNNNLIGWRIRVCVGRENNKQKWKSININVDDDRFAEIRSGKKGIKDREIILNKIALEFEQKQKEEFANQMEIKGRKPDATIMDKRKITLSQYVRGIWWKDIVTAQKANKMRPNTVSFYKYTSDNICSYFDSLPKAQQRLYSIEPRTVKDFLNYLQADATDKNGNALSQTTILRHWQTFRNIINSALRDEYVRRDPCLKFKPNDKPTTPKFNGGYFTKDEARYFIKLLDTLPETDLQWKCLMNILIQHGLRRGEAIGLQWKDIQAEVIEGKTYHAIQIIRSITPDKNDSKKVHEDDPKTESSTRTILIQPEIYDMLMELKSQREKDYCVKLLPTSDAFIFCKAGDLDRSMYPTEPTRWLRHFIENHNGVMDISKLQGVSGKALERLESAGYGTIQSIAKADPKELCSIPRIGKERSVSLVTQAKNIINSQTKTLKDVSPHDLRRTWATLANEAGVNQKAMQCNLGHSDGADTESRHYVKYTLAGQVQTLETMHSVFYGTDETPTETILEIQA